MAQALKTKAALMYLMPQSHSLPAEPKVFRGWPGGADVKLVLGGLAQEGRYKAV